MDPHPAQGFGNTNFTPFYILTNTSQGIWGQQNKRKSKKSQVNRGETRRGNI